MRGRSYLVQTSHYFFSSLGSYVYIFPRISNMLKKWTPPQHREKSLKRFVVWHSRWVEFQCGSFKKGKEKNAQHSFLRPATLLLDVYAMKNLEKAERWQNTRPSDGHFTRKTLYGTSYDRKEDHSRLCREGNKKVAAAYVASNVYQIFHAAVKSEAVSDIQRIRFGCAVFQSWACIKRI